MPSLYDYQEEAINKMKNGCLLRAPVGTGKSRMALAFFYLKVCRGTININGVGHYSPMLFPRQLFIITTAKKRDSFEWLKECNAFCLPNDQVKVTVDSWNNIKKYKNIYGCFFIFDEQRLVGNGAWVKAFYNIARKNKWILLSATPGDKWTDYIPLFVANGFVKNKTEFQRKYCVFSRFAKYPKIDRFINVKELERMRDEITVNVDHKLGTFREDCITKVNYDKEKYRRIVRDRWNIYDGCPIEETGKLFYLMRRVTNEDEDRISKCKNIITFYKKVIIFYNFTYELNLLRKMCDEIQIQYSEWNGEKHEPLPEGDRWVYLCQYAAASEGWNCITTNVVIFYSLNYSYRMMEQAAGRIDRANTPFSNLYYYYLKSAAPIDLAIWRCLKNKQDFNERRYLKV